MKHTLHISLFTAVILSSCQTTHRHKELEPHREVVECNTLNPKPLDLLYTHNLNDQHHYVKAASGLVAIQDKIYVIQDSSRYLAEVDSLFSKPIDFHPLASLDLINTLEDPHKSYEDFRRARKSDYEGTTLLPNGKILVLGSGYDAQNIDKHLPNYKNIGIVFDPKTNNYETLNLEPFYDHLLKRKDIVGTSHDGHKPRLNIEGVTIIDHERIAFFHRANFNKNSHDSITIYPLAQWFAEVAKPKWELPELEVMTVHMGYALHKGEKYPITLNDGVYKNGDFYIPVASEADGIVDGKEVDGEVFWTGIVKLNLKSKSCETYHFNDQNLPKMEGLTINPHHPDQFYAVHDVDDEYQVSLFSALEIK